MPPPRRDLRERLAALAFPWRRGSSPGALAASLLRALQVDDGDGRLAATLAGDLARNPAELPAALERALAEASSLEALQRHVTGLALRRRPRVPLVSLGSHCYTSAMLQRWQLRPWSGPFDWLFSSPGMVAHCIEDDFRLFLDRSQYEPVPLEDRKAGHAANRVHHRHYRETFGIDFIFNHHDVHLDEDYAYLVRCVERFRAAMRGDEPHAFVLTCWRYLGFEDDIGRINAAFRARSRSFKLVVIGIGEALGAPAPKLQNMHHDPGCDMFHMEPHSRWQPLSFPDFLDEYAVVQAVIESCHRTDP